jgi:type I restriction enzyme M protein
MQNNNIETLTSEVWKSAITLRGKFKAKDYPAIILPMIVLRRIECVLMQKRAELTKQKPNESTQNLKLIEKATFDFYNTTNWDLNNLLVNQAQIETNTTRLFNKSVIFECIAGEKQVFNKEVSDEKTK